MYKKIDMYGTNLQVNIIVGAFLNEQIKNGRRQKHTASSGSVSLSIFHTQS